ncbi:hypothetical protein KMW28_22895 [Flammeovirga yaeyamensis]|uniref:VOC domain-containing protein n=1 Tax=Flammeovirga yaeyamensis TaxID=367791 RepID=A0AAX1NDZ8_9BACT|nr:VOC family protein [Flammeovirga yaeyamensis]MBB3696788.1 hypothetical protein [Flammeovirga yaeyamensis]NMF33454.1 hypothetical protein [Flammeovirga yaeyamensis]QWG05271.1 hypothetical protein KMW28_22895 [Flammeovirga yaeyamensis]
MKPNHFIFADLSTYQPKVSMKFYSSVFGWEFYNEYDYQTAYLGDEAIIGLYETPNQFKQLKMPHFWMSYIQVNDVKKTVEQARNLGGIIELEQELDHFGKVALIRDPLGAGFTVYQGDYLMNTRTKGISNTLIWNELHASDATKIIPFYEGIFNWKFASNGKGTYKILDTQNSHIADLFEIANDVKGKYEYWVCSFGVKNLKVSLQRVLEHGGSLISDEGNRIMVCDDSGEAFFYIQSL